MKKAERKRRLIIGGAVAITIFLVLLSVVRYSDRIPLLVHLKSQIVPGGGTDLGACYVNAPNGQASCLQDYTEAECAYAASYSDPSIGYSPHYYWEAERGCRPIDEHPEAGACEDMGNILFTAEATAQGSYGRPGTASAHCLAELNQNVVGLYCPAGCTRRTFPARFPYNASTSTFWTREEIDRMYDGNANNRDADDLAFNVTRVCSTVAYCRAGRIPGDTDGDGDVDLTDLNNVRNNIGSSGNNNTVGDADGDGDTDAADLVIVRNNFGRRGQ